MKVTYVGDDKTPPNKTTVFGYEFTLGEQTLVDDQKILTKLRKHPCFKVGRIKKTVVKSKTAETMSNSELKDIIINNKLELKDNKKSSAIEAVNEFLGKQGD